MRVIAGEFKRRGIDGPPGDTRGLRPTSDRVRESLFNLIGLRVEDAVFLDLYAGTGAVGIEALSRGARSVTFVENAASCLAVLRGNLKRLNLEERCDILPISVADALPRLARAGRRFDIVFADPPYDMDTLPRLVEALGAGELLTSNPLVVCEQRSEPETRETGVLRLSDLRKYGKTRIALWNIITPPDNPS